MTDTRDDFEAHFKPTIRQQKRHMNGDYRDPDIQAKWLGWQAAMESVAAAPVLTDLDRSIASDAQAFEATLDYKPIRMKSTAYPWGWCYADTVVNRNFREFCTSK